MRVQLYQSGRLALTRLLEAGAGILAQSRECIANRRDVMLFAKRICKVIRASGGVVYFVKGQTTTRAGMQERKLTADPCQPQAPPYLPCPVPPPFASLVLSLYNLSCFPAFGLPSILSNESSIKPIWPRSVPSISSMRASCSSSMRSSFFSTREPVASRC